jgi:hypothetical protein
MDEFFKAFILLLGFFTVIVLLYVLWFLFRGKYRVVYTFHPVVDREGNWKIKRKKWIEFD